MNFQSVVLSIITLASVAVYTKADTYKKTDVVIIGAGAAGKWEKIHRSDLYFCSHSFLPFLVDGIEFLANHVHRALLLSIIPIFIDLTLFVVLSTITNVCFLSDRRW